MKKILSVCMFMFLIFSLSLTAAAAAPKLNKKRVHLRLGDTGKISANQQVEWFSSDDSIVTVNRHGKIKTVDCGVANVMAINKTGEIAFCEVRVSNYSVEETGKARYPRKVTVYYGDGEKKTYRVYNKLASKVSAIRSRGCSHSAIATVLSGYGISVTPEEIHTGSVRQKSSERYAWYKTERKSGKGSGPLTVYSVSEILKNNGLSNKAVYTFSDKEAIRDITANLKKGRPVIALINGKGTGKVSFSNWFHFIAMVGIDDDGNVIILDSIGGLVNQTKKTGHYTMSVETVVKKLMKSCKGNRYKRFYYKDARSYGGYVLIKE